MQGISNIFFPLDEKCRVLHGLVKLVFYIVHNMFLFPKRDVAIVHEINSIFLQIQYQYHV